MHNTSMFGNKLQDLSLSTSMEPCTMHNWTNYTINGGEFGWFNRVQLFQMFWGPKRIYFSGLQTPQDPHCANFWGFKWSRSSQNPWSAPPEKVQARCPRCMPRQRVSTTHRSLAESWPLGYRIQGGYWWDILYTIYIIGDIMGYSATASHLGSEDDSSNSSPCGSTFSGKWWSTMITQSGFLKGTSGQIEKSRALWNQNGREEHEKCDASWWGHSSKLGSQTTLVGFYMKLSNSGEIWSWTTPTLRYICAVTNILTSTLVFILTHSLTCTVTFFLTYTLTYT